MAGQPGFTQYIGSFFGGFNLISIMKILGVVILAGSIIGFLIWFFYNKVQWNLKVEFKLTRSNGEFVNAEWGKGSFNARKGVVYVKRKHLAKSKIEPFDIREYIQGSSNILTVEQVGVNSYKPVHPNSFKTMTDEWIDDKGIKHSTEVSFMKLIGDTTSDKSWALSYEREAKQAFSISSFLKEYGGLLAMGLVLFMNFLGFMLLYMKIKPA